MADTLLQTLQRVDPSAGFIEYVNTVKPYHTKILEVLEEFAWTEEINVTVTDKNQLNVQLLSDENLPLLQDRMDGWGSVWDPPTGTEHQLYRLADLSPGLGGTITVENNFIDDFAPGDRVIVYINTVTPIYAIYTVVSVSLMGNNTLLTVDPSEQVINTPSQPYQLQTYGFVLTTTVVRDSDVTTNSLIIPDLAINQQRSNHPSGRYIMLFYKTPAGSIPYATLVSDYIIDSVDFDCRIRAVDSSTVGNTYVIVLGDRTQDFPAGQPFMLVNPQDGSTQTNTIGTDGSHYVSSSGEQYLTDPWYLTLGLTDITVISVVNDVTQDMVGWHLIPSSEPTLSTPSPVDRTQLFLKSAVDDRGGVTARPVGDNLIYSIAGTKYFVVSGDQTSAYTVGDTYSSSVISGWSATYNFQVTDVYYTGFDPQVNDPFYDTGLINKTIISAIVLNTPLPVGVDELLPDKIAQIPVGSTDYVITVGGIGWSQPEYAPLASAPNLYVDSYVNESFTLNIFDTFS